MTIPDSARPLGLFIQPACLQHKWIRTPNASHIFERPERLRAVLLGVAAGIARLEEADAELNKGLGGAKGNLNGPSHILNSDTGSLTPSTTSDDISNLLSGLSINSSFVSPKGLTIVPPPLPSSIPGQILLHHPALQLCHSTPTESPFPFVGGEGSTPLPAFPSSPYLKDLFKWASEAVEKIKETGCEIPSGLGLNQGDLYLGPGSILAMEGAAVDQICAYASVKKEPSPVPSTPPVPSNQTTPPTSYFDPSSSSSFNKAFCVIRPPGHHCGEDTPSGFCYVNNVVVGALHAYLQHDIDRAIIIDFDLHHGNGTQAIVMPLNAASHAEDLAVKNGKPAHGKLGANGKRRRGWKGFYGSVHDIYSYPCEDGDLDLISDASISLAAHGQYIENIHLQPYSSESDFYERIYPKYLALLDKAKVFMEETGAEPERTVVMISAGFDACEHENEFMQRHDRRVPVSFFSRYTRDIAKFADKYAQGKILSVLEGGYSDRALLTGAMGHVIGMLNKEGLGSWWTESELTNIEKATKKKRTGKLAPFPPELSSFPHLVRTHAILSHFESFSPEPSVSSTTNTPQQAPRRTLRDRRKPLNGDEDVITPPATTGRARAKAPVGLVTPNSTPKTKIIPATATPMGRKVNARGVSPNRSTPSHPKHKIPESKLHPQEPSSDIPGKMAEVTLGSRESSPETVLRPELLAPIPAASHASASGKQTPRSSSPQPSDSEPRIILRIPRRSPSPRPSERLPLLSDTAPTVDHAPAPPAASAPPLVPHSAPAPPTAPPTAPSHPLAAAQQSSTAPLYPPLPPPILAEPKLDQRLEYREGSANTTSSATTEGYMTATTGISGVSDLTERTEETDMDMDLDENGNGNGKGEGDNRVGSQLQS